MTDYSPKEIDFLNKMNWEGGAIELYFYGYSTNLLPEGELRTAWTEFQNLMKKIEPLISLFDDANADIDWDKESC